MFSPITSLSLLSLLEPTSLSWESSQLANAGDKVSQAMYPSSSIVPFVLIIGCCLSRDQTSYAAAPSRALCISTVLLIHLALSASLHPHPSHPPPAPSTLPWEWPLLVFCFHTTVFYSIRDPGPGARIRASQQPWLRAYLLCRRGIYIYMLFLKLLLLRYLVWSDVKNVSCSIRF